MTRTPGEWHRLDPCREVRAWISEQRQHTFAKTMFAGACSYTGVLAAMSSFSFWGAAAMLCAGWGLHDAARRSTNVRQSIDAHVTARCCRCGGRRRQRAARAHRDQLRAARS